MEEQVSEVKMSLPIREIKIFQTDDARRIEQLTKVSVTTTPPLNEDFTSEDILDGDVIFVGVLALRFPIVGPQECRFKIEAKDITEAFEKYNDIAEQAAEKMGENFQKWVEEQQREKQRQQMGQIVTAPAEALNHIPDPKDRKIIL